MIYICIQFKIDLVTKYLTQQMVYILWCLVDKAYISNPGTQYKKVWHEANTFMHSTFIMGLWYQIECWLSIGFNL